MDNRYDKFETVNLYTMIRQFREILFDSIYANHLSSMVDDIRNWNISSQPHIISQPLGIGMTIRKNYINCFKNNTMLILNDLYSKFSLIMNEIIDLNIEEITKFASLVLDRYCNNKYTPKELVTILKYNISRLFNINIVSVPNSRNVDVVILL